MTSAVVLKLPNSAAIDPPRKSWPGALPKSIYRFRDASYRRYIARQQAEVIGKEIEELTTILRTLESTRARILLDMNDLRKVQPGSTQARLVAMYIDWNHSTPEVREWRRQHGLPDPKKPYGVSWE